MTPESLKQSLQDLIALLSSLDGLIPDKVDQELINFLTTIENSPWLQQLVINALNMKQGKVAKKY
jgi:hypothetical protein